MTTSRAGATLRARTALVVVALLWGASACSGDDAAVPGPTDLDTPPPDGATVAMVDFAYEPAEVEVEMGEAVVFTNEGDEAHTVTQDDGGFDSGEQLPGETFRLLTDETTEEVVAFHCELHPDMEGTVRVRPAGR